MVQVGIMGKHPGYGDFLQSGLSDHLVTALNGWLDATLPPMRDQMGADWGPFWDGAQDLRFWMGRAVLGRTVAGVLHPSRDRVGRRFPLLLAIEGGDVALPLGDAVSHTPWDKLTAHLEKMEAGQGASALLEGLSLEVGAESAEQAGLGPTLWAHHPEGDLDALLASAEAPDAARAKLARSYWWAPGTRGDSGTRAATWLGCAGLPTPQALGWLLGGVPVEAEAET